MEILAGRLHISEIRKIAASTVGDAEKRRRLWSAAFSPDRSTAVNALWVMSHLPASERAWLQSLQPGMIDLLLSTSDPSMKRILLHMLRQQSFEPDAIRTDFLDWCLEKINSECEPYAVRAFCIYLSFKMCRHYPELISELNEHLDMLAQQPLTPGLSCARRKTLRDISALNNNS